MNGKIACLLIAIPAAMAMTQIGRADCTGCSEGPPPGTIEPPKAATGRGNQPQETEGAPAATAESQTEEQAP